MKPASVINRGENFVTLRATTDRPAEIREALAARDVLHVVKGDQNQAWDAVLANHCLSRAVGEENAELTFFIQDEKLGTADARLLRSWKQLGLRYVLTEDYYRGRSGAVWEHQDVSYGLFFTEAVSPEQFARAGVNLQRAAAAWERCAPDLLRDARFTGALAALGVALPGAGAMSESDPATRLGPAVYGPSGALLEEFPVAGLFYALTKTDGLYGIVPAEDADVTLSSIPAGDPQIMAAGQWLLVHAAAKGAMRLAGSPAQRRGIKQRARQLAEWASRFLAEHPDASITDFQDGLGRWLTAEIFPADRLELDRTSHFTALRPDDLESLRAPERTLHFYLDLALRHPREFVDAYNEALNRVGFGLQRLKYDPETGRLTLPFFVEHAPEGPGTPVYRYGIELEGIRSTTVTLSNATAGEIVVETDRPVRSAYDLARALFDGLEGARPEELVIVGKAAPFAAELQRSPRGLGLPRQGSKYAPMVDHFIGGLRARGVLDQPTGLLIRIGLNALDRLEAMGDLPLRVPRFLEASFGARSTCREVARRWRSVAGESRDLLDLLSHCRVGQHVHLAKAIVLNARGGDWSAALAADGRLRKLADRLGQLPGGKSRLRALGRDVPAEAAGCMAALLGRREELLAARREVARAAVAARESGRVVPRWPEGMEAELERIDCQLLLLLAAYVRRLWQRAESLPYLNDRPYTLALYLLFGKDIFPPICRQVEFDVEYISPCVTQAYEASLSR